MTETLFQKLEEKMMALLSEVEFLRKEMQRLNQEKDSNMQKLQGLVSLLDSMNLVDNPMQNAGVPIGKPILVQG